MDKFQPAYLGDVSYSIETPSLLGTQLITIAEETATWWGMFFRRGIYTWAAAVPWSQLLACWSCRACSRCPIVATCRWLNSRCSYTMFAGRQKHCGPHSATPFASISTVKSLVLKRSQSRTGKQLRGETGRHDAGWESKPALTLMLTRSECTPHCVVPCLRLLCQT